MTRDEECADKIAGGVLVGASVGLVVVMWQHPTRLGDTAVIIMVHAILDVLAIATAYGLFHMALRRGVGRPGVLAGCVFYAVGLVANLGATVVNGFAVPQIAADGGDLGGLLRTAEVFNQTLAVFGVAGTGAAFLLWSLGLVRSGRSGAAAIGVFGVIVGAVPILLIAVGHLELDKHGALFVYAAQAAWVALIGGLLWSGCPWSNSAHDDSEPRVAGRRQEHPSLM